MFHMLTWSMDCVAMLIVYNIAETCRVHGKLILALARCFTRSLKTKMPQFMNVLKRADVPKRVTPTWFIKIRWHHVSHETHLILISSLSCTPSTYMSSSHWCLNFILRHLLHSVSDLFFFFHMQTLNWLHSRSLRSHSFCRLGLLSHELVAPWPWVGLKWPKENC